MQPLRNPTLTSWRIPVLATALLALCLAACDTLEEPERFMDRNAHPPQVAHLNIADLKPGQHIAGTVPLSLHLDSLGNRIEQVVFSVDDQVILTKSTPPYAFDLNTWSWDQGPHDVTVGVYVRGKDLGLGSILDAPAIILTTPLVFDQTPPRSRDITSVALSDDGVIVTWEESTDANFYAYLVIRHANWKNYYSNTQWRSPVIDTVFDRSSTTYLDTGMPAVYGARSDYQVAVWNRSETAQPGAGQAAIYGTDRPDINPRGHTAVFSPTGNVMYALSGGSDDLIAVNTSTNEVIRRVSARVLGGSSAGIDRVTSDPDVTRLYVRLYGVGNDYKAVLLVLDPTSFEVLYTLEAPEGFYLSAVDKNHRIFGIAAKTLYVLDGTTGTVISQLTDAFADPSHVIGISPDGHSVYVFEYLHADAHALHRIDVSGDSPVDAVRYEFPATRQSGPDYNIGPDGRVYLRVSNNLIEILDGETFQVHNRLELPLSYQHEIRSFVVTSDRIFIAHSIEEGNPAMQGRVVEYSISGLRRLRSWDFMSEPGALSTNGHHHLYVSTYDYAALSGWVVPL